MAAKFPDEMFTTAIEKDDFIPDMEEAEVFQDIENYFRKSDEILQQQKLRELVGKNIYIQIRLRRHECN